MLDAKVPKRTIEARKRKLMKLQQKISKRAKQQWVGRELVVLAEGESEETSAAVGRPHPVPRARNRRQSLHQRLRRLSKHWKPGSSIEPQITEAHDYDLVARVVSGPL